MLIGISYAQVKLHQTCSKWILEFKTPSITHVYTAFASQMSQTVKCPRLFN